MVVLNCLIRFAILCVFTVASLIFADSLSNEYQMLSSKVKALEEKSASLEAQLSGQHPESRFRGPQAIYNSGLVIAEDKSYTITIGGYARLDLLYTPEQIADHQSFTTATIPVKNADNQKQVNGEHYVDAKNQVELNAKQSRLNLLAEMPLQWGKFIAFIEGDFWGDGVFRLRHAFGEFSDFNIWGGKGALTLGQTDSSFAIPDSQPNTVDFQGPNATFGDRFALIRFRQQVNHWLSFQLGIERNQYNVDDDNAHIDDVEITVNEFESNYPMVVAALMLGNQHHNIQFSAAYANLKVDLSIDTDSQFVDDDLEIDGHAFNLGGMVSLLENTHLRYYAVYSKGLGLLIPDLSSGYAEGISGLNANKTQIKLLESYGFSLNLEQILNEQWSTNLIWSTVTVDNTQGQPEYAYQSADYWAANIMWTPTKQFMFGLEFLYGTRENKSGQDGDASRVQFAAQFNF